MERDQDENEGGCRSSTSTDIHLRDPIRQDRYVSRHLTSLPALNRMPGYSHACQFQPVGLAGVFGCVCLSYGRILRHLSAFLSRQADGDLYVNVNIVADEIRVVVRNCCTRSAQTLFPPVCHASERLSHTRNSSQRTFIFGGSGS